MQSAIEGAVGVQITVVSKNKKEEEKNVRNKGTSLWILITLFFTCAMPALVAAQVRDDRAGRFTLGADLGVIYSSASDRDEVFGLNAYGDYFFNQNFSIGPLVQFAFSGDLFSIGPSAQLKYTHDIDERWKAHAQGGIGFIYANLDRSGGDRNDTSFLLPLGAGIEYKFTERLSAGATVIFNFMDLEKVRNENFTLSLLGGIKFRF
jgi:Outer membrane protein beta-barrel domain